MLKILFQRAAIVAFLCAATVASVHAATTTWYLSGITFDDGATATGWFDYDDSTGMGDYSLSTTAGPAFSAFTYVPDNSDAWSPLPHIDGNIGWLKDDGSRYLTFTLAGSLTGATGNVAISSGLISANGSWEHLDIGNLLGVERSVAAQTELQSPTVALVPPLSAVPELESYAMLIAGLVSSLLFSAAHHMGALGEPWSTNVFVYRTIAGAVFATIFYYRSLAHAVYTHAFYDVYVGLFLS